MRINRAARFLADVFTMGADLPRVIDVGASPLGRPAYGRMLAEGRCAVWGFEPQEEQFAALQAQASDRETYFPNAVGTGGKAVLNVYRNPGFTSLFPIREASINYLGRYRPATRLAETVELDTTPLDALSGLPKADLLKIDVQGSERDIIASGRQTLSDAVAIIPEVRFYPLYEGEPGFGELHDELCAQGFRLHKFLDARPVALGTSQTRRLSPETGSQLVDGDAVYIRPPEAPDSLTIRQLKCLALFATEVFHSIDLALRCLDHLVVREAIPRNTPPQFVERLPKWMRAAETETV